MLSVAALIGDHDKARHAVQKLRGRGVPPEAIRVVARDAAAAREAAVRIGASPAVAMLVGGLTGALVGGAVGWMLGGSANPLAGLLDGALAGAGRTGLVGLALGVVLGLALGWLLAGLGRRRLLAAYEQGVQAGDLLLVVEIAEAQLRETEELLRSYGARDMSAGPLRPRT